MEPIFAGAVFTEWYWGPIFVAIFVGIPLLTAGLVFDGVVTVVLRHRGAGARSTLAHVKTVGAFVAVGAIVIYAIDAYGEHREREQQRGRAFAAITFPLYEPQPLPSGHRLRWAWPERAGGPGARLRAAYLVPGGTLLVTQRASVPGVAEELAERCGSGPRHPSGPVEYSPSSCRPHPTPGGRLVSDDGRELAMLLGATRVRIEYDPRVARTEAERFADALRRTPERELELELDGDS